MGNYKIIAATGCPTGIAHTFMAQEALEAAAKSRCINQGGNTWTDWCRK